MEPQQGLPVRSACAKSMFNALFRATAETLVELGYSRLGARIGATLVLHTWTRALTFHPHLHAIVTAGGLALDGTRFVHADRRYLFPVKVMGKLLRGKLLALLSDAYAAGALAHCDIVRDPRAFSRLVAKVAKLSFNVHAQAPFGNSSHVVKYLGRYTHRVGIANSRLLDVTDQRVLFTTRKNQTEALHPVEFLWRLVQHVLPDGFHKIRHIGLYGSPKLATARERLGMAPLAPRPKLSWEQKLVELTGRDVRCCPVCQAPLLRCGLPALARAPPNARARDA